MASKKIICKTFSKHDFWFTKFYFQKNFQCKKFGCKFFKKKIFEIFFRGIKKVGTDAMIGEKMQRTLQIHVFSTQSTVAKCCGGSFEVVSKRRGELYIAPFDIKRHLPEMSISFLYNFCRCINCFKSTGFTVFYSMRKLLDFRFPFL